jgi:hypothetical protein
MMLAVLVVLAAPAVKIKNHKKEEELLSYFLN